MSFTVEHCPHIPLWNLFISVVDIVSFFYQEKCILSFTGQAPAGQYFIYLMVEDLIPSPRVNHATDLPLSSVPVHLSLTGEADNRLDDILVQV